MAEPRADKRADKIGPKGLPQALDEYQALLAIGGDKRAFTLLYKRWHARFLRFACRLSGSAEEGQDILQEAAITIAGNIHKLQDPTRFSAWAYTIIRRRAADHIKANIRRRNLQTAFSEQAEPTRLTSNIEIQQVESLTLKQALARLPDADRTLLSLFYVDGLTGAEMAAAMDIPLGTIKSRLFKARKKLQSHTQTHPHIGDNYE